MTNNKRAGEGQFLTFKLDKEIYAMEITNVREVLDYITVTRIPQMPKYMKGVINLRGGVVPVVDLRLKFGLKETRDTVDTCIIIVEIEIQDESQLIGAMADSVQEVMEFNASHIEPPPKIGTSLNTEFIKGMGKVSDEFIIIIDIEKIFSTDELTRLALSKEETNLVEINEEEEEEPELRENQSN